jgi:hypothetical protein
MIRLPRCLRHGRSRGARVASSRMPDADPGDLERDRRLSRFNDLFTVGLLVRDIRWQLGKLGQAGGEVLAPDLVASGMGPR